jgi:hypothetical protein
MCSLLRHTVVFCLAIGASLITAAARPATAQAQSADPPLAIHGFNDLTVKNAYLTPRGLLVTNNGLTVQVLNGLVLNTYHNPATVIDDVSFVAGIWNDLDAGQHNKTAGAWNEFDWFVGTNLEVDKVWGLGVSYVEFLSPAGNFSPERNVEFSAKFDDSPWLKPIALHPYAKLFLEVDGPSVVVTGKGAGTFDVELGVVPTLDLHPYSIPATLTAPTWITVGPSDFWGGGGNVGVFSTGATATFPLDFVPKPFGGWNFHLGVQYYNMVNNNLLLAQQLVGSAGGGSGHRNFAIGFAGIGLNF